MLSSMLNTIAGHRMLEPGDRVLVAISGGPDSTALLAALVRLADRLAIQVEAATVDHGLRPESAAEAAAVIEVCRGLGVSCERLAVDVAAHRQAHVSLQDAARRARAAALIQAARRRGCARVALGHTADDQAETVLFRIVRGTGVKGLGGIPYRRDPFIRPLLDVRRAEVLRFLRRRGMSAIEDPSNRDARFTRSRVRAEWLPFLARENPRIVEALLALSADSRGQVPRRSAAGPAGIPAATPPRWTPPAPFPVPRPGSYRWGPEGLGWQVDVDLVEGVLPVGREPPGLGRFAADCLDRHLQLRSWLPGDRMRPRGSTGGRKLQDLFVDAKVPRAIRGHLPVLLTGDGTILYVPGLRPAEQNRPRPDARAWVEVRLTGPGAHLSC